MDFGSLIVKANAYKRVLENTQAYRKAWHDEIKPLLLKNLEIIIKEIELKAEIKEINNIENLEAVILDLGKTSSGISESLEDTGIKRTMIKQNGALIYQQLFNGKVMVMLSLPNIDGYGEPKPPRSLEILRPDELKEPFVVRHVELLLKDITDWEDYDDDQPAKNSIGFNPIGFGTNEEQVTVK
jgi:hypothetical protein